MSRYWLRHPKRDQLIGPDVLENLLGQIPADDPEEWAAWQALPAQGQSYSALKSNEGWIPLAQVAAESSRQAWLERQRLEESGSVASITVPAELDHMRPGIVTALEGLPEKLAAAHNDKWPLVLRQLIRHGTAYGVLRTAAGVLAVLAWCAIGLTALLQLAAMQESSGAFDGPQGSLLAVLMPLAIALILSLVVLVLLHLVWLLCDLADQNMERLRQSTIAPAQPVLGPASPPASPR